MRGLFLLLLAASPVSNEVTADVTSFYLLLGDEVKDINCSKLPASILEMQKNITNQERIIYRYQELHPMNDLVEGENLLILTKKFKLSFLQQELAVLEFGNYYCKNPEEIPASGKIDVEALLM